MPYRPEWGKQQKAAHNDHLMKAAQHSQSAIKAAQAITENVVAMQRHALPIAAAALGRKAAKPANKGDLVGTLTRMNEQAWAIVKSRERKLTPAELKRHHEHLKALIPEYARNGRHAQVMAQHWNAVTRHLRAIADMYSKYKV
jgi:DNA gyrase/topoisomerase IV subunit A